jgi:hypothetical protein
MLSGCHVTMVHGSADAAVLNRRAISAMSVIVEREIYVDDAHRPINITVARNGSFSAPSNIQNFRLRVASTS